MATGRGRSAAGSSSSLPSTFASIALRRGFGVGVAELLGLPLVRERLDEPMREIHFLLGPALASFREVEVLRRSELVSEAHHGAGRHYKRNHPGTYVLAALPDVRAGAFAVHFEKDQIPVHRHRSSSTP